MVENLPTNSKRHELLVRLSRLSIAWGEAYRRIVPKNPAEDNVERLAATSDYQQEYIRLQNELERCE